MDNSGKRFESILSSFCDGLIVVDSGAIIEWVNPSAQALVNLAESQLVGQRIYSFFKPGTDVYEGIEQAVNGGPGFINHDTIYINGHGHEIPIAITVNPLDKIEGGGATVALRDLGPLKALERFMALNEKMVELSTLAAGMAHEIKNPLGGIRGAAQLIGMDTQDDSTRELSGLIVNEADRINRLVIDLLASNQPGKFAKGPVNIYPILDDCLKLIQGEMDKRKVMVVRKYDPSLPEIWGEPDKLRQIFLNLIKNGIEASGRGGYITLATNIVWQTPHAIKNSGQKYVLIEVIDEGHGLDESARAGLFTPYFTQKKTGSGLGLSVTLGLVQAHNGLLEINNRKDAHGAVAKVYLPYKT